MFFFLNVFFLFSLRSFFFSKQLQNQTHLNKHFYNNKRYILSYKYNVNIKKLRYLIKFMTAYFITARRVHA